MSPTWVTMLEFPPPASGTENTLEIRPCQKFQGHSHAVWGVIHLLGGERIMTGSSDGSLRVWNLKTGEQIGDVWQDEQHAVYAIALSLDGKKVVCGCKDGVVKLWDINTGKLIAKWTGATSDITSVCWNRDCGRVVITSVDGTARVWDVERGKIVLAIETGLDILRAVIYSPDMTMIATGGDSKDLKESIKIWDAKTGKIIANLKGRTEKVCCLAWTADGSTLVSGSSDFSIGTWNTTTWQQIHVLTGHAKVVRGIAISPNGLILASASWDYTVRLWNLENGLPIGSPLRHPLAVQCVSFSTDGKLLVTGCRDNNAYSLDISGILEEAGLLNSTDTDELLIDDDTSQRPVHKPRDVHQMPPRFFDNAPCHPHPSRTCNVSSFSAHQNDITEHPSSHRRARLSRLFSLFQRNDYDTHDAPSRPSFLEWARNTSFHLPHRWNNEDIQLQARLPAVVDVPVAQGSYRNYSAREARWRREKEKEKARNAKNAQKAQNATNVSAGSPRPDQNSAGQQSGAATQAQASSEAHATVSTSPTDHAIAATPTATALASLPDAVIPRAGRWTRFWLFIGCVSAQYSDGHN